MKVILALVSLLIPFAAAGEKTITSDSENYYAIGESDNSSIQLAKDDACNSARRELIGHIFGAAYQINQNMIRSLGVLEMSQDVAVNSGEVVIRGAITETTKHKETTKCTITYPVSEAKLEKERLKSANAKNIRFTEIGDANSIKGGVLEVVTVPDEVEVLIDNVRWGVTPLRLHGKLTTGSHLLRLDDENYKVVEVKIEIGTTSKTRVDKILKRATGKLNVKTDPTGAKVKINGQEISRSPISSLELLAGQKLKIEIDHPEAESYSQSVQLKRDEEKTLNLKLPLKPAYISLNTDPPTADITIDDSPAQTKKWIRVEPGRHTVKVEKKGFISTSITVDVVGGDRKAIPTIKLASQSEADRLRLEEAAKRKKDEYDQMMYEAKLKAEEDLKEENQQRLRDERRIAKAGDRWRSSFGIGWSSGATVSNLVDSGGSYFFEADIQKNITKSFSVRLGFTTRTKTSPTDNSISGQVNEGTPNTTVSKFTGFSSNEIGLILPWYFHRFYYAAPEFGLSQSTITSTDRNYNSLGMGSWGASQKESISQNWFGIAVGYETHSENNLGCYAKVEIRKYSDSKTYTGATTTQMSGGMIVRF